MYYKETQTGQYTDYYSQTPWYFRTAWVKSLINRTRKICSDDNKLKKQLNKICSFMSRNNFPNYIVKRIIQREIEKPL